MQSPLPPPRALSLQDKLDRIAHERDVLELQRRLANDGLREGDAVRRHDGSTGGRLLIARDEQPPRLLVQSDDGTCSEYATGAWRRA
jgi:hypothetical protein